MTEWDLKIFSIFSFQKTFDWLLFNRWRFKMKSPRIVGDFSPSIVSKVLIQFNDHWPKKPTEYKAMDPNSMQSIVLHRILLQSRWHLSVSTVVSNWLIILETWLIESYLRNVLSFCLWLELAVHLWHGRVGEAWQLCHRVVFWSDWTLPWQDRRQQESESLFPNSCAFNSRLTWPLLPHKRPIEMPWHIIFWSVDKSQLLELFFIANWHHRCLHKAPAKWNEMKNAIMSAKRSICSWFITILLWIYDDIRLFIVAIQLHFDFSGSCFEFVAEMINFSCFETVFFSCIVVVFIWNGLMWDRVDSE